jgi:DNA relaxase NicK
VQLRTDIKAAWQKGQHSGFRELSEYSSGSDWRVPPEETMYVGSRQSSSFLRIYDKGDRTRLERQTGRDIADTVLCDLLRVHEEFRRELPLVEYDRVLGAAIVSHLTNGIDFLDRKDKNLSRGQRCPFWSEFLAWLKEPQFKVVRHAVIPMLEKTMQWLDRQVSKTLSVVKDILGSRWPDWVSGLISSGKSRYKSIDERKIEIHRVTAFS